MRNLLLLHIVSICVLGHEASLHSAESIDFEMEHEKDLCQQLKQANDTAARLRDELRQAKDRERQVQMQLDKMRYATSKLQLYTHTHRFTPFYYRAMHYSAKRGIAIACRLSVRLSVCLSVCNVGELGPHRLEMSKTNCTDN